MISIYDTPLPSLLDLSKWSVCCICWKQGRNQCRECIKGILWRNV